MKKLAFYCVVLAITSCTPKQNTPTEQVTAYYEGYKTGNYNQVKSTLADSLTLVSGDFVTPYTPETYFELFKWDSVFQPQYSLVSIDRKEDIVTATFSVESVRYAYLKNNPLVYTYDFHFKDGNISKIIDVFNPEMNWELWGKQRAAIVSFIKTHHPELDGFMNDLTMKGAQNYMKAIELYRASFEK